MPICRERFVYGIADVVRVNRYQGPSDLDTAETNTMRSLKFLIPAVLCAMWAMPLTADATQAEGSRSTSHKLDIPAQDLHAALQQWAVASHHKIFYRSELVAGKVSPAIKGDFTASEAVQKLLAGTGLV